MTPEQLCEFEQRRLEMMRKHVATDPALRRVRRQRHWMTIKSIFASAIVVAVALMLLKAFVIAYEGEQGYARLVGPIIETQDEDSYIGIALKPDPVTTEVADFMSSFVPRRGIQEPPARPTPLEQQNDAQAAPELAPELQSEPERLFPALSTD